MEPTELSIVMPLSLLEDPSLASPYFSEICCPTLTNFILPKAPRTADATQKTCSSVDAIPYPFPHMDPSAQVWRPWSVPPDGNTVRRRVCGLLNKLTAYNFDSTSTQIVQWSVICGRSGNAELLALIADSILRIALLDEARASLYADLSQRIEDEVGKESARWSRVNHCPPQSYRHIFTVALRNSCFREFDRTHKDNSPHLLPLMRFLGYLLRSSFFSAEDIQGSISTLFTCAENGNEECTIAICRLLRPIIRATDGSRLLEQLNISDRIERVLEEDTITYRIRFLLMAIVESMTVKPVDVFESEKQRTEIYGLDLEDDGDSRSRQEEDILSVVGYAEDHEVSQHCHENVQSFFAIRDLGFGDDFVQSLPAEQRPVLVESLVQEAVVSGDVDNASLVASLFSLPSVRRLCIPCQAFLDGFMPVMEMLEDAILDNPDAYGFVARMLHACTLRADLVERLASKIHGREHCKERFLDQYFSLFSRFQSRNERSPVEGEGESGPGDQRPVVPYAYAF